jgi:glutathione S-transferase
MHHSEPVPSAIERYQTEAIRILTVLNTALEGKEYLVGGKCTAADLEFLTWLAALLWVFGDELSSMDFATTHPNYHAWFERLMARESVQKVFSDKKKAKGDA